MNDIKCIFCEINSDNIVIEENGYKGKKCPQCNLIYISPQPSIEQIIDLYGHDDAHISAKSHISKNFIKRLYARHHLKIIRSLTKKGRLLEIGSGAGYFLDEARKIGFNPYGLELNPVQAKYIRSNFNIPCEESKLNDSIFGDKKFDIIYHSDVISHLLDPISDLKKMNNKMNDSALLVFETGNLGEVDQKYYKYFEKFQYPDHLFFFSTSNLTTLLEQTGFQLIKIHRYSIIPELILIKVFLNIRKYLFKTNKEANNLSNDKTSNMSPILNSKSYKIKYHIKKNMKKICQYFHYFIRYKIGAILPNTNRPQTIIVVAKKINKQL